MTEGWINASETTPAPETQCWLWLSFDEPRIGRYTKNQRWEYDNCEYFNGKDCVECWMPIVAPAKGDKSMSEELKYESHQQDYAELWNTILYWTSANGPIDRKGLFNSLKQLLSRIVEREIGLRRSEEKKPEEEITGWVAWHPDKGANINSFNDVSNETALFIHVDSESGGEDYGYDDPNESWAIAQSEGWRIRPVKVVFTDDGGEK